jgi:glycine/D-amino acid oxidase-like deaminating enzyme
MNTDVVVMGVGVIGVGVIGSSIGLELARSGREVVVVDKRAFSRRHPLNAGSSRTVMGR